MIRFIILPLNDLQVRFLHFKHLQVIFRLWNVSQVIVFLHNVIEFTVLLWNIFQIKCCKRSPEVATLQLCKIIMSMQFPSALGYYTYNQYPRINIHLIMKYESISKISFNFSATILILSSQLLTGDSFGMKCIYLFDPFFFFIQDFVNNVSCNPRVR